MTLGQIMLAINYYFSGARINIGKFVVFLKQYVTESHCWLATMGVKAVFYF